MSVWLIALLVGVGFAVVQYAPRRSRPVALLAGLLRATAVFLVVALLLDAPLGRARPVPSWVALDVSASWLRGAGTDAWREAQRAARAPGADTVLAFGDSVRPLAGSPTPNDLATRVAPVVEHALARGRPLVVVTDGEVDDPEALAGLPVGSRVVVVSRPSAADAAIVSLEIPRALVGGDTVEARVVATAGAAGAPASTIAVDVGGRPLGVAKLDAITPFAERAVTVRGRVEARAGGNVARAIVTAPGDVEPRNDTAAVGVDVAEAAGAVFASTSPDYDSRYALAVLRGALAIPTRGYVRVAPGSWRVEGSLAPVAEPAVRQALRDAPVAILHGDTAIFGPPRALARGPLALVVRGDAEQGEWYGAAAPASPLAAALSGLPWDSLPPVSVPATPPSGEWIGLEARRGREQTRRALVVGSERPRRTVVVAATGLWRWRFRGGTSADAFTAVWGSIFDWLAEQRADRRAAVPDDRLLRAGEPVVWRRGSATDSAVTVTLRRRAAAGAAVAAPATLALRFAGGETVESAPLAPGVYDAAVTGGTSVLVVNASRELLPRAPRVKGGAVGSAALADNVPRLRGMGWVYAVALLLLCAEWMLRRRIGLR